TVKKARSGSPARSGPGFRPSNWKTTKTAAAATNVTATPPAIIGRWFIASRTPIPNPQRALAASGNLDPLIHPIHADVASQQLGLVRAEVLQRRRVTVDEQEVGR